MPKFVGPIKRTNHGKGHSYRDANGHKVPGVTTILSNGFPAPGLIAWSANTTIDHAIDNWDELAELPPSDRMKRLRGARFADRDDAANRGTQVHRLAENVILGAPVEPPEELRGHLDAYVSFLDEWNVQPYLLEAVVASQKHGYAGTLDLIADLIDADDPTRTCRWLLDIKTSRSGVFGNHVLQLAAYRYADTLILPDNREAQVPPVDHVGVVHVRADGYDLVPVYADREVFRSFLYVQQIAAFSNSAREYIGDALTAPAVESAS